MDTPRQIDRTAQKSFTRFAYLGQRPFLTSSVLVSVFLVSGMLIATAWTSYSDLESKSEAAVTGTGLKGEYYDNVDFTTLKLTRTDPDIAFNWMKSAPISGMGRDSFSIRWSGYVLPLYSEQYTFTVATRDIFKLSIDGVLVASNGTEQRRTRNYTGVTDLTADTYHTIQIEYQEKSAEADIKLTWQSPSQPSASVAGQLFTEIPPIPDPLPPSSEPDISLLPPPPPPLEEEIPAP